MNLYAAAGLAEISEAEGRALEMLIFWLSLIPCLLYAALAVGCWIYANRETLRQGMFSVRALLVLVTLAAVWALMLRGVYIPYWWTYSA
jgi:glucan phosphoethanolaminetransferase (alkaline phosphatase superfamily)